MAIKTKTIGGKTYTSTRKPGANVTSVKVGRNKTVTQAQIGGGEKMRSVAKRGELNDKPYAATRISVGSNSKQRKVAPTTHQNQYDYMGNSKRGVSDFAKQPLKKGASSRSAMVGEFNGPAGGADVIHARGSKSGMAKHDKAWDYSSKKYPDPEMEAKPIRKKK